MEINKIIDSIFRGWDRTNLEAGLVASVSTFLICWAIKFYGLKVLLWVVS